MEAIKNYAIDFKPYVINQKLINYYNDKNKPFMFNEYDLAKLIFDINEKFGSDIDKQDGIKAIIDY